MKLLILGDTHFNKRGPERRKDNYFNTQLSKLSRVFDLFDKEACDFIIQVGDFFDTPTVGNYAIKSIIEVFKEYRIGKKHFYGIYGQHDIVGHSGATLPRSPLAVMEASQLVSLLGDKPNRIGDYSGVYTYGASFGQPIPEVVTDGFNILVIHDMIGPADLYPGQNITKPRSFAKQFSSYDLICCGDYHYAFDEEFDGRHILNAGCMVRKTIGKHDLELEPSVIIYDTETREYKYISLEAEPVETVFDFTKNDVKDVDTFNTFIEELKDGMQVGTSWKQLLQNIYEVEETDECIKVVVDDLIEELNYER